MSYLISAVSSVQLASPTQNISSLLRYNFSAIEVDTHTLQTLSVDAGETVDVNLPFETLVVLSVKSAAPVQLSFYRVNALDPASAPVWGIASDAHQLVIVAGITPHHLKLKSTRLGTPTLCEVLVAGRVV